MCSQCRPCTIVGCRGLFGSLTAAAAWTTHGRADKAPAFTPAETGSASGEVRGPGGQRKSELRASAVCRLHGNRPTVRLDQPFDNEQPQACPATPLGPPELTENPRCEFRRDSLTLIAHGHGCSTPGTGIRRSSHHDCHRTSTVAQRILNKVAQDLINLVGIQPHLRDPVVFLEPEPILVLASRHPPCYQLANAVGDVHHLAVHLEPPGFDARYIEQFGDKPGDTVRVSIDGLQHDTLIIICESVAFG